MFRNGIHASFRRGFISTPKTQFTTLHSKNLFASKQSLKRIPFLLSSSLLLLAGGVTCSSGFANARAIHNETPSKPYPLSAEITPADAVNNFNSDTQRERRKKVYRQITTGSLFGLLAGTVFGKLSRVIFVICGSGMVLFEWLLTRGIVQRVTGSSGANGSGRLLGLFGLNGLTEELHDLAGTSGSNGNKSGLGASVNQFVKSTLAYMKVFPAFKLSFFLTFALAAYNI